MTEYSHGAGCGCKISPSVLSEILKTSDTQVFPNLLVGNDARDDAAVVDLGDGTGIISTTDFFMPIVDDPFEFGRIAAANAISDIYAMGGSPLMAIAIFGWPLDKLPAAVGQQVIEGGRSICKEAGIPLAGGHSIDAPEPIFGLAVTGRVSLDVLQCNNSAQEGDVLYITKPIGIGMLTTAEKKKCLQPEHQGLAAKWMMTLNSFGQVAAQLDGVNAITDVTGFGLGGHGNEMAEGANLKLSINVADIPLLPGVEHYISIGCTPGGTHRNYDSYSDVLGPLSDRTKAIVCDPQTSGGLLIAVSPDKAAGLEAKAQEEGYSITAIGRFEQGTGMVFID